MPPRGSSRGQRKLVAAASTGQGTCSKCKDKVPRGRIRLLWASVEAAQSAHGPTMTCFGCANFVLAVKHAYAREGRDAPSNSQLAKWPCAPLKSELIDRHRTLDDAGWATVQQFNGKTRWGNPPWATMSNPGTSGWMSACCHHEVPEAHMVANGMMRDAARLAAEEAAAKRKAPEGGSSSAPPPPPAKKKKTPAPPPPPPPPPPPAPPPAPAPAPAAVPFTLGAAIKAKTIATMIRDLGSPTIHELDAAFATKYYPVLLRLAQQTALGAHSTSKAWDAVKSRYRALVAQVAEYHHVGGRRVLWLQHGVAQSLPPSVHPWDGKTGELIAAARRAVLGDKQLCNGFFYNTNSYKVKDPNGAIRFYPCKVAPAILNFDAGGMTSHAPAGDTNSNTLYRRDIPLAWRAHLLREASAGLSTILYKDEDGVTAAAVTDEAWNTIAGRVCGWSAAEIFAVVELAKRLLAITKWIRCHTPEFVKHAFSKSRHGPDRAVTSIRDALYHALRDGDDPTCTWHTFGGPGHRLPYVRTDTPGLQTLEDASAPMPASAILASRGKYHGEPLRLAWSNAQGQILQRLTHINDYIWNASTLLNAQVVRAFAGRARALQQEEDTAAAARAAASAPPPMPTGDDAPVCTQEKRGDEWHLDPSKTGRAIDLETWEAPEAKA